MSAWEIDPSRIEHLTAREEAAFRAMRPRSLRLLERAKGSLPTGVPMSWMASLHQHPPIFAEAGDGAWFSDGMTTLIRGNELSGAGTR